MSYNNNLQREADQVGYFDPNEESEMFAKRLVSAISKGNDHISLTLTEKALSPSHANYQNVFWQKRPHKQLISRKMIVHY